MLDSPELAISRVKERVKLGGHFVPDVTVRRRYVAGLKNFFSLYKDLADSWQIYDNSSMGELGLIASKMNNKLEIQHVQQWQQLIEVYDEVKSSK